MENLKWFLFMCSMRAAGDGIMTWHMLHGLDISTCVERKYKSRSCLNSMLSEFIHFWLLPVPKSIWRESQFTLEIDIEEFAASWRGGAMTLGAGIRWKNNDSEKNRRPAGGAAKLMNTRWSVEITNYKIIVNFVPVEESWQCVVGAEMMEVWKRGDVMEVWKRGENMEIRKRGEMMEV